MNFPTWGDLFDNYCSQTSLKTSLGLKKNPFFEEFARRRYNPSPINDTNCCRLIFLKDVLQDQTNKTLRRQGRFIWCKNLHYEGRNDDGYRQFSFTVDKGKKRFKVSENNVLCLPSKVFVHNNRYFRSNLKTFTCFSTVFGHRQTMTMMRKSWDDSKDSFEDIINQDNPFKPGTLVLPRVGYFHPDVDWTSISESKKNLSMLDHPCGIVLGKSLIDSDYVGREFYRVRFGDTTYEKVHPVQMEIINEV
jgi:hypothetical protein